MTATECPPVGGLAAVRPSGCVRAATAYAERGWPVLPGSVWDGRRYVVAANYRPTDGLRPVLPRDQACTDVATVARWWRVTTALAPAVLVVTGRAFDAVSVSRDLAVEAVQTMAFCKCAGASSTAARSGPRLLHGRTRRIGAATGRGAADSGRTSRAGVVASSTAHSHRCWCGVLAGLAAVHRLGAGERGGLGRGAACGASARRVGLLR